MPKVFLMFLQTNVFRNILGLLVAKKYKLSNKTIIKSYKKNRDDLVKRPYIMYLDNKKLKKFLKIKNISINNFI